MIVKSFTKPTDIVLIGTAFITEEDGDKKWEGDFLITDDYQDITLLYGDRKFTLETDGFFCAMTMDAFNSQRKYLDEDVPGNFIFLPGFTGEVKMRVEWTRKEFVKGEGRQVVETHIVDEFPNENDYVLYVNRPGDEESYYDWDYEIIVEIPSRTAIVINPNDDIIFEDDDVSIPKIDNYQEDTWDQSKFWGSKKFQHTQIGMGFFCLKDESAERGIRKDIIKDVTHNIARKFGKYMGEDCVSIKFVPYKLNSELDKIVEKMEDGPFEAQLEF